MPVSNAVVRSNDSLGYTRDGLNTRNGTTTPAKISLQRSKEETELMYSARHKPGLP